MKIIFDELASYELNDAIDFYNFEQFGLGDLFKREIVKGLKRIKEYPNAWSAETSNIKKYILHKFPYKIYFLLKKIIFI